MIKKTLAFMLLPTMIFILTAGVGLIWGSEALLKSIVALIVGFVFFYLFVVFGIASYDLFFRGKEMTNKTPMPEPVAWMHEEWDHTITNDDKSAAQSTFSRYRYGLITTAQAEAYADACVRGALENAAMILKANAEACNIDTAIILRANAEAMR